MSKSILSTRNMLIAAGGVGAVAFLFPRTAKQVAPTGNPFETQGVRNVGDRFSSGGGSNTHTPGVATPRGEGNSESTISNQETHKGVGTPAFDNAHADQKFGKGSEISKQFYQAHTGNDKGK